MEETPYAHPTTAAAAEDDLVLKLIRNGGLPLLSQDTLQDIHVKTRGVWLYLIAFGGRSFLNIVYVLKSSLITLSDFEMLDSEGLLKFPAPWCGESFSCKEENHMVELLAIPAANAAGNVLACMLRHTREDLTTSIRISLPKPRGLGPAPLEPRA